MKHKTRFLNKITISKRYKNATLMYSKLLVLCYFEIFNTLIVDIFRPENSLKSRAHLSRAFRGFDMRFT